MFNKWWLFSLIVFLFIMDVSAIGISPSKEVVFFESGQTKDVQFYVVNRDSAPILTSISIGGEFANISEFNNTPFILNPNEKKYIDIRLKLPLEMSSPGDHELRIVAQEIVSEEYGDGVVGATAAVIGRLIIRVPKEGSFLGAHLSANSVSVGEDVNFKVTLENLGTLELKDIQGVIIISDSKGKEVDKIEFVESLAFGELKLKELFWDSSNFVADHYSANLVVQYSGKSVEASTNFKLGDVSIKIISFQKEIIAGEISEYESQVESGWNNPIENVFVKLQIEYEGNVYTYKSESFDLEAFNNKDIKMFIDAREIEPGEYPATFGVYYDGLSNEESFQINVKKSNDYLILLGGISILVIILLLLYLLVVRKKLKLLNKSKKNGKK